MMSLLLQTGSTSIVGILTLWSDLLRGDGGVPFWRENQQGDPGGDHCGDVLSL